MSGVWPAAASQAAANCVTAQTAPLYVAESDMAVLPGHQCIVSFSQCEQCRQLKDDCGMSL